MRVMLTTDTVGGVWTFTRELAQGLLDNGIDIALVGFGRKCNAGQRRWVDAMTATNGERFRYVDTALPLEWMQNNEGSYSEAEPLLLQVAEAFHPDVLHLSQYCFGVLPVSCPKLITAHSDVLSWAACCRKSLEQNAWLERYRNLVSSGLDNANVVAAPTIWMLAALAVNFNLPLRRVVVPNGRSISAPMNTERKLRAITVGRLWDEGKNIGMLTDVHSPMPLLIAGDATYEDVQQPEATGLTSLGLLDENEILASFSESSIYICTSLYEPFGLAPLEAALCGCAILAHDIASLREVWDDAALYFASADDLSQLLHELANNNERLQRMRAQAMQRAQRFTREQMTADYLQLYGEVCQREKRRVA